MAKDEVEVKGPQPTKLQSCCKFVWNPDTHEFLGRTGKSWAQILIYYVIFYACLAAFFAINLAVFMTTIDSQQPRLQGFSTLLKGHPGMGFRPLLNGATLVQYVSTNVTSANDAINNIDAQLVPYLNQSDSLYQDCNGVNVSNGKLCRFNTSIFGPCNAGNDYGYNSGSPCILLKLNKIYGWQPEPLQPDAGSTCNSDYNTTTNGGCMPPNNNYVAVTCSGEVAADVDNLGGPVAAQFAFYPPEGFSYTYYPYTNQPGYLAPLVMAQVLTPTPGALIMVWCKAWANNIYHDRNDLAGSIHFELLVDSK